MLFAAISVGLVMTFVLGVFVGCKWTTNKETERQILTQIRNRQYLRVVYPPAEDN